MITVGEADLEDREYRVTVVDEAQMNDLEDSPRYVRFEVVENRGINCKIAGIQLYAGQSGFRGTCTVTATCNLSGVAPRLSFDAGKCSRCSVPLPLGTKKWRFIIGAQSQGASIRLLSKPLGSLIQRLHHAESVMNVFVENGGAIKPCDLPNAFAHDLFADWWGQLDGGADEEKEAARPRPWLKVEVGELCSFGAGVSGCNGTFRPVEYDDGGHVVLYMNDQGAIMFRVEEGWRMNSEFNVSEFDYSSGADPAGAWIPQVPAKAPPPTVCGPGGPPSEKKAPKKNDEKPPEDAWTALASKLSMIVAAEKEHPAQIHVPGAGSIGIRVDAIAPCGFCFGFSADETGKRLVGILISPDDSLELPMAKCSLLVLCSGP
jgi:hypothetical protein